MEVYLSIFLPILLITQISAHTISQLEHADFEQKKLRTRQSKPIQDEPEADISYKPQGRNMEFSVKLSPSEVLSHLGQPIPQPAPEGPVVAKPYAQYQPRQPCYSRGTTNYALLPGPSTNLSGTPYEETPVYPSKRPTHFLKRQQPLLRKILEKLVHFLGHRKFFAEPSRDYSPRNSLYQNVLSVLPCLGRFVAQCLKAAEDVVPPYSSYNVPLTYKQSWLQKLTGLYAQPLSHGFSNILDTLLNTEPDSPTKNDFSKQESLEPNLEFENSAEGCYQAKASQPSSDENQDERD